MKEDTMSYTPPFTVSAEAINLIADISALVERFAIRLEQDDGLRLRKANRIKTIHSSLAIEGNELTEGQVSDILEGKTVVAPIRQIQEVRNAIRTYELFPSLDPFKEKDLLKAHSVMMEALIDEAGRYRRGGVGVFGEKGIVHLAPPAQRVPVLMSDLFGWLKKSKDHLLIRSCVFHYEFEFIHPFADGNGRMGRLWQSLILSKLHPVFAHLPVENLVYANQQAYYDVLGKCGKLGESGPFIDFMLGEIYDTLKKHQGEEIKETSGHVDAEAFPNKLPNKLPNKFPYNIPDRLYKLHPEVSNEVWAVLAQIIENPHATSETIGAVLGISSRMVRNHISKLKALNLIERIGSNKTGYWKLLVGKEDEE